MNETETLDLQIAAARFGTLLIQKNSHPRGTLSALLVCRASEHGPPVGDVWYVGGKFKATTPYDAKTYRRHPETHEFRTAELAILFLLTRYHEAIQ